MNPQRWDEVKRVFTAALEQPDSERSRFVVDACQGDHQLAAEVRELLAADGEADSFLSMIALHHGDAVSSDCSHDSIQVLPAGSVVSARFQISRLLGTGGMGHVYEAVDLELGIAVALKTIRPDIASDQRALARFKKEVQLTRRIAHPNVCRVFDIGRHVHRPDDTGAIQQDFTYLTMELLDGPTLSAVLSEKKRFSPADALPIAEQIAAALAAAHSLGIVHRDIKPSNIMLVPNDGATRVVVTDFGLARLVSVEDDAEGSRLSLTERGKAIGTFAYMAPEQLVGASITPQTDIYAFGLLLYEMLTGVRAWGSQALSSVVERLKNPPANPSTHLAALDPRWERAILGCVPVDPAARFQTASEVVEAIEGAAPRLADQRKRKQAQIKTESARHRPTLRRVLALLASLIIVVALSVGTFRYYKMKGSSAITPGESLLLTDITNTTGDPRFDAVTELLRGQLSQSALFRLVKPEEVREVLHQMVNRRDNKPMDAPLDNPVEAREVALRTGSPRVIFGTLSHAGDDYTLHINIEEPDNEPQRYRAHWSHDWSWQDSGSIASGRQIPAALLDSVRNSADWVRQQVGEQKDDIFQLDQPPQDVTTDNWEALSQFALAQKFILAHQREQALVAFQNAVAADPHFALAHTGLGDLLVSIRRYEEGYEAYRTALAEENKRRLTRRERDTLRGLVALDTGDYAAALATFQDYAVYYPHDYLGFFYQAYPLMMMERVEEALTVLKKAEAIEPRAYSAPAHIARFNMILGRLDEAQKSINRLRDMGYGDDANDIEAGNEFLRGNYQHTIDLYKKLQSSKEAVYRTRSYLLLACVLAELGRYKEAIKSLNDGIEADVAEGDVVDRADKFLARAYLELKQQDYAGTLADTKQALALDHSWQRSADASSLLGQAAAEVKPSDRKAYVNELRQVEVDLPKFQFAPLSEIVRARVIGETALAEGNVAQALKEFEKASSLDAPANPRDYLAQALPAAADRENDTKVANEYRAHALELYKHMIQRPGQTWQLPEEFPPGYYSDEIFSYAQLAAQTGELNQGASERLAEYRARRHNADSALNEVDKVERLMQSANGVK